MPIIAEYVIPRMFLPELTALRDSIFSRVLPAFDGLESETEKIQQESFERMGANAGEYLDGGDLAEAAFQAGLEHFELMTGTLQIVINAFAVGLAHLFEQQRHLLIFNTLLESEPNSKKREERFYKFLKIHGIDRKNFVDQARLIELHLVANVAKHAEGQSADCLRKLRPELFIHPSIREYSVFDSPSRPVNRTMMGDDLFIQPEDLRSYFDAVESFWKFVQSQLTMAQKDMPPK